MNTLETTRNLFYDRPSWTKNELAQQTSLSMAGLTKHLSKLLSLNFIFATEPTIRQADGPPSDIPSIQTVAISYACLYVKKKETAMFQVVDLNNRPLSFCEKKSERLVQTIFFRKSKKSQKPIHESI